ncbi:MAG TPA: transglycosylase SLT domain-containing protein, partial [Woeseiaceae bacterium]|nr:transglycosylase SLT domain-containing protein [Woeseiaceae bacterium]
PVIEDYLARHGPLKPARDLRYRYALELATRGDWAGFEHQYAAWYAELREPVLDCLALQARIHSGDSDALTALVPRARALWLVGRSQVDECDPVFSWLETNDLLRPVDYRDRYALAIEAESFGLARWLGRSIDERHVREATGWLSAQSDPGKFLDRHGTTPGDATRRAQLAYAAERLAWRDPVRAEQLFRKAAKRQSFSDAELAATRRQIALWSAREKIPGAAERLAALPAPAVDDEVRRWRARAALYLGDWDGLLEHVAAMPDAMRAEEEWRYWRAIALRETGGVALGAAELAALAGVRSYYGFLAADELEQPYAFSHAPLDADETGLADLATRHELVRARELFLTGLESRGRSEWDAAMATLSAAEQAQAAVLAHRWGWHSRAIATVAAIGRYDDLELRYPLPYQDAFDRGASAASVAPTWALGIARSESLFMPDVRSGAGAVGIMQLMPGTGNDLARELDLPWSGLATLTDPVLNIRLGTAYLGRMSRRFDGNRILATAAYNAGPERVSRWVPRQDPVDARIWIENIPYNETRRYVRRVLEAETIFHWRLTGETRRLADALAAVHPAEPAERVASASR